MPTASTTRLTLPTPTDYVLARDVCSYGYFLLAPTHWDPQAGVLWRVLTLTSGDEPRAVLVHLSQSSRGEPVVAIARPSLTSPERAQARAQLVRMLRLDEDERVTRAFHRVDPRFRKSGRCRLLRSPTLFEDVLKTVTSCNVQWPGTIAMNQRLCVVYGPPLPDGLLRRDVVYQDVAGYPTPESLAKAKPATLRARCRVGYRDARIIELARLFATNPSKGGIEQQRLEDPATPDEEIWETLLDLPGIGPYAAANIMQLLGRYARLPLDTESVRHGRTVLGMEGTPASIMRRVKEHFAPFGEHAFRSYWFEMWAYYESRHGPASSWQRETTGRLFTAAVLNKSR